MSIFIIPPGAYTNFLTMHPNAWNHFTVHLHKFRSYRKSTTSKAHPRPGREIHNFHSLPRRVRRCSCEGLAGGTPEPDGSIRVNPGEERQTSANWRESDTKPLITVL
ncbi:hypothetical protein J6590_098105 [Homalodisca vitripennis]|nr:hypothetical protein J6590_098105 [Homalodisca vitripennis]